MSISPTFYEQLFRTNYFRAAFLYLHCRFKLFRRKEIGAKAAPKMLVKLTPRFPILSIVISKCFFCVFPSGKVERIESRVRLDCSFGSLRKNKFTAVIFKRQKEKEKKTEKRREKDREKKKRNKRQR